MAMNETQANDTIALLRGIKSALEWIVIALMLLAVTWMLK
jgi:hypothetical protein